jgi:hypothetical protein
VGGNSGGGWCISQGAAITLIESGEWEFFVEQGGRRAKVIVAVSWQGNKYLKTEADGEQPNNLLSLPTCRV